MVGHKLLGSLSVLRMYGWEYMEPGGKRKELRQRRRGLEVCYSDSSNHIKIECI